MNVFTELFRAANIPTLPMGEVNNEGLRFKQSKRKKYPGTKYRPDVVTHELLITYNDKEIGQILWDTDMQETWSYLDVNYVFKHCELDAYLRVLKTLYIKIDEFTKFIAAEKSKLRSST